MKAVSINHEGNNECNNEYSNGKENIPISTKYNEEQIMTNPQEKYS